MLDIEKLKVQENVQNLELLQEFVHYYVHKLIEIRKDAGFNQEFIAKWLNVDRRKIIALEGGQIDIVLLCRYAQKLDVDINFNIKK